MIIVSLFLQDLKESFGILEMMMVAGDLISLVASRRKALRSNDIGRCDKVNCSFPPFNNTKGDEASDCVHC
jgi:hypothetical protein